MTSIFMEEEKNQEISTNGTLKMISSTSMDNNQTITTSLICTKCEPLYQSDVCLCNDDPYEAIQEILQRVPFLRVTLTTYFICIGFGAIGNLLTLFTMATADRKNKSGTNMFLISLAIADLLYVFIAGPMEIVQLIASQFVNSGACKLAEYSRVLSGVASILNLLAVTTERFIVIVFPMRSRSICTMTNCRRSLIVVWGLSLLLAAPVLWTKSVYNVYYGNNETLLKQSYCNDFDDNLGYFFTIYQLVVCFALPALIMIVCYSVVIRVLWKSTKNMSLLTNSGSVTSVQRRRRANSPAGSNTYGTALIKDKSPSFHQQHQPFQLRQHPPQQQKTEDVRSARKQVIKMLICVVILFLLCWGPRFIMELLMKMQPDWMYQEHVYNIKIILFLLPLVHAILNPVVYFIMSRNFRMSVMAQCTQCPPKYCCCSQNPQNHGSFGDLTNINSSRPKGCKGRNPNTKEEDVVSEKQFSTLVQFNGKSSVQTNQELVMVHANGEVTLDLIDKCQEL